MGMEAKHREGMASRPPFYDLGFYDTEFHVKISWSMSVNAYSHRMEWLNRKFTFGDLKVVL
ncbi:hypothetical protein MTR67_052300 [Solanum verrucosum]|uniref:Uncharacterized protein n=1 Tax=Solanum verrucosum TaxID=315347 RepID=A0AAF0V5H7_SOLVR|nr:hypothetical protein MTR67_052300 [Solanum verrucosum]